MAKYFFRNGNNNTYTCSRCNWEGDTPDIRDGKLSESYFIYDVFCPTCKKYLEMRQGEIIQMLIPEEIEKKTEFYKRRIKTTLALLLCQKQTEENELKLSNEKIAIRAKLTGKIKQKTNEQLNLF
jgi:argonaute-like protein implicated in RNA metabolism and viral defense